MAPLASFAAGRKARKARRVATTMARPTVPASANVALARRRWMREQGMFGPAHLVFVDETAANTKMVRLSGRVPQGHWKTITFVAALRRNCMRAPCTIDGSMNGAKFLAYVKQCLAPTLSAMITS
jgi:hypothetical protein